MLVATTTTNLDPLPVPSFPTITHHLFPLTDRPDKNLRQLQGSSALITYYCSKHNWSLEQYHSIHWRALSSALKNYSQEDHTRLLKLMHGWLPTLQQRFDYGASHTNLCPAPTCWAVETQQHIFACTCPCQLSHRDRLFQDITSFCATPKVLPPAFGSALSDGLRHWLSSLQTDTPDTYTFPTSWSPNPYKKTKLRPKYLAAIQAAYTSQASLGWAHPFYGRLSNKWAEAYCICTKSQYPSEVADRWIQRLIQTIWRSVLTLWSQRNTHLAEQTKLAHSTPDDLRRDNLGAQIEEAFYNGPYQTLPEDHPHLFQAHTTDSLKEASLATMQRWLDNYDSSVEKYQMHLDGRINNPIDRGPIQTTLNRFFAPHPQA